MTKRLKARRFLTVMVALCVALLLSAQPAFADDSDRYTKDVSGTPAETSDQAPEIDFYKLDGNDKGKVLPGAVFRLYECDKNGNHSAEYLLQWKSQDTPFILNGAKKKGADQQLILRTDHYYALEEYSTPDDKTYSKLPGEIVFTFDKEFGGQLRIVNGDGGDKRYEANGVLYAETNPKQGNSTSGDTSVTGWSLNIYNYKKDSEINITNTEHGQDTVNHVKRSKEGMAQTSDLFNPAMTAVIVLIGAALVILGIKSRGKKKDDEPVAEAAEVPETAAATADAVAETSETATAPAEAATTDTGEPTADATAAQPDDSKKSDD